MYIDFIIYKDLFTHKDINTYNETLNNEYIGRIYQMSSWQIFNEFYTERPISY